MVDYVYGWLVVDVWLVATDGGEAWWLVVDADWWWVGWLVMHEVC